MGNSHNTTPTKCIDCGRIRPRNQMYSGPRCHNCHTKADPERVKRKKESNRRWARKNRNNGGMPSSAPVSDGGISYMDVPINIDDPYLREYIDKARRT